MKPTAPNARVFLWDTIYEKILSMTNANRFDIDVRYLQCWFKECPKAFPKFMLKGNYTAYFNMEKYRWEVVKGKKIIKFDPSQYVR